MSQRYEGEIRKGMVASTGDMPYYHWDSAGMKLECEANEPGVSETYTIIGSNTQLVLLDSGDGYMWVVPIGAFRSHLLELRAEDGTVIWRKDGTFPDPTQTVENSMKKRIAELEAQVKKLDKDVANERALKNIVLDNLKASTDFDKWAQSYLDAGRWAGHRYDDAIKTELLERDAQVADLTMHLDEANKDIVRKIETITDLQKTVRAHEMLESELHDHVVDAETSAEGAVRLIHGQVEASCYSSRQARLRELKEDEG